MSLSFGKKVFRRNVQTMLLQAASAFRLGATLQTIEKKRHLGGWCLVLLAGTTAQVTKINQRYIKWYNISAQVWFHHVDNGYFKYLFHVGSCSCIYFLHFLQSTANCIGWRTSVISSHFNTVSMVKCTSSVRCVTIGANVGAILLCSILFDPFVPCLW